MAGSSVVRRAYTRRSRTELGGRKVVDDGRKNDKNGNFAADSSKLTTKKRKGSSFVKKSSKKAAFYKESSSSAGESNGTVSISRDSSTDGDAESRESTEDTNDSSSEDETSDEDGGLKPSREVMQSLAAEDSSAAEPTDSSEEDDTSEEASSSTDEYSESEETGKPKKEAEMERGPEVIDISSGDEDPLPSKETPWPPEKIYHGPASRTRSKKSTKATESHKPELSRKWTEPSSVSKQKKKKPKNNLQRGLSRNAAEEISRRRDAAESRQKKCRRRMDLQIESSSDRVSDMLSSTKPSSSEDITEVRKRKDRLRTALKTNPRFNQLLMNSMVEKEDEIAILTQPEPSSGRVMLPRKFNFRTEVKKPERTQEEKDMDPLWMQMELALIHDRIGSSALQACELEEVVESGVCPKGKHRLFLNEEIGWICSICSHVETEIKDVLPSFANPRPSKRQYRDDYRRSLDDLDMDEDDNDSEEGSNEDQFPERGTVWDLVPRNIRSSLFPHQKEGFEFMWKNIGNSIDLEELRNTEEQLGGGCIISHAPGTGKTRLTLVFLKAYIELFPKSCPIVIAPASMLLTWEEEFRKCKIDIPFHNLNNNDLSMKEKHELLQLVNENSHLKMNIDTIRLVKLYSWSKTPSVLGISYSLFVDLEKFPKIIKVLLEEPGVVVLDEGHTPRNGESRGWNMLCKLKTKKRIILSGTPFQNNCSELRNTLKLVRPVEEKRIAAKLDSLKTDDIDRKAAILKKAVTPFAHVYKGSILQKALPGLRNCAVVLNPTEFQLKILQSLQKSQKTIEFQNKQALVTVHPSLALKCKLSEEEKRKIESTKEMLESCRGDPNLGAKTRFLLNFVRLSMATKEKVLIFSQFKKPLKLIMDHLCSAFNWIEGQEIFIMSGNINQKQRQTMIGRFNDPYSEATVLLASIKACSEGINLVGASRVILLDVVWNPSVERQAISRAYRLGQKKVVYTYHLMMKGSSEGELYNKQAKKQKLSEFMFSSNSDAVVGPTASSEDMILEAMTSHAELKELFHQVIFQPRENNLMDKFGSVDQL